MLRTHGQHFIDWSRKKHKLNSHSNLKILCSQFPYDKNRATLNKNGFLHCPLMNTKKEFRKGGSQDLVHWSMPVNPRPFKFQDSEGNCTLKADWWISNTELPFNVLFYGSCCSAILCLLSIILILKINSKDWKIHWPGSHISAYQLLFSIFDYQSEAKKNCGMMWNCLWSYCTFLVQCQFIVHQVTKTTTTMNHWFNPLNQLVLPLVMEISLTSEY